MKEFKKEDIKLFFGGRYTRKFMPNGEIRTRLVLPDGTRMSYTEMCHYDVGDGELPWQEPHLHKGLVESYTLVSGWAHFIYGAPTQPLQHCRLTLPGHVLTFQPGAPHVVLLGPEAKIIATLFGEPIANPDYNSADWWPADTAFANLALLEQAKVEEELFVLVG